MEPPPLYLNYKGWCPRFLDCLIAYNVQTTLIGSWGPVGGRAV